MRYCVCALLSLFLFAADAPAADAGIVVRVSKAQQVMRVYVNGRRRYVWPVSTGRRGYRTPRGSYRPKRLVRYHRSRKYYNAPMPHSIFFRGGYAIHGSYATRVLGRPASHGCIRLHPAHARRLFRMVQRHGLRNTRIIVR